MKDGFMDTPHLRRPATRRILKAGNNMRSHSIVSIVIPVHNGAKFIGEQLESLHKQQYEGEVEIIVVDNLSTDSTIYEVQKYLSMTGHIWGTAILVISEKDWNKVSPEDKVIIEREIKYYPTINKQNQ